jgi:ZIP family zinc transporter
MSFAETALLGAIAGCTIFLGLPFGRVELLSPRARVALAMFAVGILSFLFVDVLGQGFGIVERAVEGYHDGTRSLGDAVGLAAILAVGFCGGTFGLGVYEARMRQRSMAPMSGGATDTLTAEQATMLADGRFDAQRQALRRGMTIATAIGLHNFSEGLAIGVSASTGDIGLATVLIVGFALHNATEGFGIVGPLGDVRPSWRWLALAGLVGGGPTFLGTIVGYNVSIEPLALAFYALAGGAILYVISEVWNAMRRFGNRELALLMVSAGFMVGFVTDLVVAYGGG